MKRVNRKMGLFFFIITVLIIFFIIILTKKDTIQASTVVTTGSFRLTAENRWDEDIKKNYAELDWEIITDLSKEGYKLYQSKDGKDWESKSLKYDKKITVLNIYPNIATSNTLKGWMNGLNLKDKNGDNLIEVTSVSIADFNANPTKYLKGETETYIYDVLMFGSYDSNYSQDLNTQSLKVVQEYVATGRGVLFGHDTVYYDRPYFRQFGQELGVDAISNLGVKTWTGSQYVKLISNGYLMKYPFEMQENQEFYIPYSHNIVAQYKDVGTVWMEYIQPSGNWPNSTFDSGNLRGGWYLKTNNNLAMIQTGHSNGASTEAEQKIIANVLYNLAQVSEDNNANDQTVIDDVAPAKPTTLIDSEGIIVNATDRGKEYQWYVEANTKSNEVKKSDVVKETITSNIAGYFYMIDDQSTSTLQAIVEAKKNEYGRITEDIYEQIDQGFTGIFVDPKNDDVSYNTKGKIRGIDRYKDAGKYLHVLAVDRMSNVSEVTTTQISAIPSNLNYEIERTDDELKLVDLNISDILNKKMKAIEIQVPVNTEIKDYETVKNNLPTNWETFENSSTDEYNSYGFSMKATNDLNTIKSFLEKLRFTITKDKNNVGNIKIILRDEVFTSWVDSNNINHYYKFVDSDNLTWMESYNLAKKEKYKGLTGYLATLTSREEHIHVYENIAENSGWLGGSRMIMKNPKQKLNDSASISTNIGDYYTDITNGNEWYWVNGPETGQVFFDKPTYAVGGKAPAGMYQGFNNKAGGGTGVEPNNSGTEYVLEFAQASAAKSMYWNDLNFNKSGTTSYKTGYYVEFSAYGDQIETELDENDVAWSSRIPQKIELKAYDEVGKRVEAGDIIYDQQIRIGQTKTVVPTEVPRYKYLKLTEMTGEERTNLTYIISNEFQEGKLIYGYRNGTIHVRQVIVNQQDEMVVPSKGYGVLSSYNIVESNEVKEKTKLILPSSSKEGAVFETRMFTFNSNVPIYRFEILVPMYYQLKGYVLTEKNENHSSEHARTEKPTMDFSKQIEYWLTTYIEPSVAKTESEFPNLYQWDYKENDLGKVQLKK